MFLLPTLITARQYKKKSVLQAKDIVLTRTTTGQLSRWFPGTTVRSTLQKVGVDQFLFAPVFNAAELFLLYCLEARPNEYTQMMRSNFVDISLANWVRGLPSPSMRVVNTGFRGWILALA